MIRTEALMGTLVSIQVVRDGAEEALDRAFGWFYEIEDRCTKFNDGSELRRLTAQVGVPVAVSAILFEAIRFAVMVAEESGGAFDVVSGEVVSGKGNYRDIVLDPEGMTIALLRPLQLDLGAVAKGLAVDMAAAELALLRDFAIDAGGDQYFGGRNPQGEPWSVGIRHPRLEGELIETMRLSNQAICTSGDYERGRHIRDPRTGLAACEVASATVVAPGAMLADALATAAFVLGPRKGIELLRRMGMRGLIVTPEGDRYVAQA